METVTESIKIRSSTKLELDKTKEHPRESYDDVISRLLGLDNGAYEVSK